jgi:DNA polymerase-3 subunit alpha
VNSYQVKSELANGSHRVEIAGIIQKKDSRMSARGRFITIQLSDQFGNFEVTIFNEEILKNM